MKARRREDAPDGLQERRRLKLAGVTDEAVLEAAWAMRHPLYRRQNRLTPAEHRELLRSRSERPSPEQRGPGGGAA